MVYELEKLLDNFDDLQLATVAAFAQKIAFISHHKYTGKITFDLDALNGGIGNMRIHQGETVNLPRKRRIRSPGI